MILLAIPFIQLGLDVYLSVSFGAAVIALLVSGVSIARHQSLLVPSIPLFLGYIIKIVSALLGSMEFLELLVILRELFCYFVFLSVVYLVERFSNRWEKTRPYLTLLFMAICIFAIVQAAFITRGHFIGLPTQYFVINQDTLVGIENLVVNGYRFRATGFYGEPSYLSFVVMTLMTVLVYTYEKCSLSLKGIFGLMAFGTAFVVESFSGVLAIGLWSFVWVLQIWIRLPGILRSIFPTLFFVAATSLAVYFGEEIGRRYEAFLGGNDESGRIRLEEPLEVVQSMEGIENLTGVVGIRKMQIDNGILLFYIRYGFISFLIVGSMAMVARDSLAILYLFIAFNFNGSILAYDKVVLFGLAIGSMRYSKSRQIETKARIIKELRPATVS